MIGGKLRLEGCGGSRLETNAECELFAQVT